MAYTIGLRPWEFWALTPAELHDMLVADQIRDRREWERTVLLVRTVRGLFGDKHPPTTEGVIGPPPEFSRRSVGVDTEDT